MDCIFNYTSTASIFGNKMNHRKQKTIYFDNAATTFPKPEQVYKAVNDYMHTIGVGAGRSAHRQAVAANGIMFDVRERLAAMFGARDGSRIIFTPGATASLNLALLGTVKPGELVAVSSLEHNAVMRPLRVLQDERQVKVEIIPCTPQGMFELPRWEKALQKRPKHVVVNHGSNVIGSIAPLSALGALCRKYGARFIVDAAQTAGLIPLDVEESAIDFLAFSGHKNLYGLQGTGGLYIRDGYDPQPLFFGGTGSRSESDEQPLFMPDRYESGTQNMPGIASLAAGTDYILKTGITSIFDHDSKLAGMLLDALRSIPKVRIYGPQTPGKMLPTISITLEGMDNAVVAQRLNDEYSIAVRVGLHCAPNAHRTIGTFPFGTIRISFGFFTTEEECKTLIAAVTKICKTG
jgi:cysteine desulfurase / selenocysteine lyase